MVARLASTLVLPTLRLAFSQVLEQEKRKRQQDLQEQEGVSPPDSDLVSGCASSRLDRIARTVNKLLHMLSRPCASAMHSVLLSGQPNIMRSSSCDWSSALQCRPCHVIFCCIGCTIGSLHFQKQCCPISRGRWSLDLPSYKFLHL